jgi:HPt (histidine-containing phosphotransfer) domain-containing protein
MQILDAKLLLNNVDGDRELLEEIVQLFFDSSTDMLTAVREAVSTADGDALQRSAHRFKGSLGNMGAESAAAAASELESLGRRGSMTGLEQALARLEDEFVRLTPHLQGLVSGHAAPNES